MTDIDSKTLAIDTIYNRAPSTDDNYRALCREAEAYFAKCKALTDKIHEIALALSNAQDMTTLNAEFQILLGNFSGDTLIKAPGGNYVALRDYIGVLLPATYLEMVETYVKGTPKAVDYLHYLATQQFNEHDHKSYGRYYANSYVHCIYGYTPAHIIIAKGDKSRDALRHCFNLTIDRQQDSAYGQTVLHFALRSDLNTLHELLKDGNNINCCIKLCIDSPDKAGLYVLDAFLRMRKAGMIDGKYDTDLIAKVEALLDQHTDADIRRKIRGEPEPLNAHEIEINNLKCELTQQKTVIIDYQHQLQAANNKINELTCKEAKLLELQTKIALILSVNQ